MNPEGPFKLHHPSHIVHDMMMYVTDYVPLLITTFTLSYDTHDPKQTSTHIIDLRHNKTLYHGVQANIFILTKYSNSDGRVYRSRAVLMCTPLNKTKYFRCRIRIRDLRSSTAAQYGLSGWRPSSSAEPSRIDRIRTAAWKLRLINHGLSVDPTGTLRRILINKNQVDSKW